MQKWSPLGAEHGHSSRCYLFDGLTTHRLRATIHLLLLLLLVVAASAVECTPTIASDRKRNPTDHEGCPAVFDECFAPCMQTRA
jgi:hypothetical protein